MIAFTANSISWLDWEPWYEERSALYTVSQDKTVKFISEVNGVVLFYNGSEAIIKRYDDSYWNFNFVSIDVRTKAEKPIYNGLPQMGDVNDIIREDQPIIVDGELTHVTYLGVHYAGSDYTDGYESVALLRPDGGFKEIRIPQPEDVAITPICVSGGHILTKITTYNPSYKEELAVLNAGDLSVVSRGAWPYGWEESNWRVFIDDDAKKFYIAYRYGWSGVCDIYSFDQPDIVKQGDMTLQSYSLGGFSADGSSLLVGPYWHQSHPGAVGKYSLPSFALEETAMPYRPMEVESRIFADQNNNYVINGGYEEPRGIFSVASGEPVVIDAWDFPQVAGAPWPSRDWETSVMSIASAMPGPNHFWTNLNNTIETLGAK